MHHSSSLRRFLFRWHLVYHCSPPRVHPKISAFVPRFPPKMWKSCRDHPFFGRFPDRSEIPCRANLSSLFQIQSVTIRLAISALVFPRIPNAASRSKMALAEADNESCALSVRTGFLPLMYLQLHYSYRQRARRDFRGTAGRRVARIEEG